MFCFCYQAWDVYSCFVTALPKRGWLGETKQIQTGTDNYKRVQTLPVTVLQSGKYLAVASVKVTGYEVDGGDSIPRVDGYPPVREILMPARVRRHIEPMNYLLRRKSEPHRRPANVYAENQL